MKINPHNLPYPPDNAKIYWATVRYSRHWISSDGPWSFEVQKSSMTVRMLKNIAIRYNIMRGINPDSQQVLCELINEASGPNNWPRTLIKRSEACLALVQYANSQNCFIGNQVSAATKFMWFMRPKGWTMFDRLAANGLQIPANLPSSERMLRFYQKLNELQIQRIWNKMQNKVDTTTLKGLPAPRIVDNILFSMGSNDDREYLKNTSKYSMALLPQLFAVEIHNLACDLQNEFGCELEEKLSAD